MKLPNDTWVLIADGAKALILVNQGDSDIINLRRVRVTEEHHARSRDLGADKPGAVFESTGARRSAHEDTDLHEAAEQAFLHQVAQSLEADWRAHRFTRLVIVAPPRAMAVLRASLGGDVAGVVMAEITKDLTHHAIPEIESAITQWSADA